MLAGRQKSPFASVRNTLIRVPGMNGAYISDSQSDVLYIHQPIGFMVKDEEHALQLKDELASWLVTNETVPLQFDDEPGRTYYAKVDGTIEDFNRFVDQRRGTITFLVPDGYSYGPEKEVTSTDDAFIVENNGTAESDPIFELTAKKKTTFALVSNGSSYNLVGNPVNVEDEQPYQKYERILTANGTNLSGWTTADYVDGGIVSGAMESNGSRFQAQSFGSGNNWHGPAIKRALPEVLTDFSIKTTVAFGNTRNNYIGRIEMYLLDVNGNTVAKIGLKDNQGARQLAIGEARAGDLDNGKYLISESGDRPGVWNDFYGVLQIERQGNDWRMYIAKINRDTGIHHSRRNVFWTDSEGLYSGNVAQVVLHVGTVGEYTAPAMGFYGVMVDKINQEPEGVPYIADVGDKIVFNHVTGDCYVNGEPVQVGTYGIDFFKLSKGYNTIAVSPEDSFDTKVVYKERFR